MRLVRPGTPWKENGLLVCSATHPQTPNWSGHSRGRKLHLAKTAKLTICNMLVDEVFIEEDKHWSIVGNGKCKVCYTTNRENQDARNHASQSATKGSSGTPSEAVDPKASDPGMGV